MKPGDLVRGQATMPHREFEWVTGELLPKGQLHEKDTERAINPVGEPKGFTRYVHAASLELVQEMPEERVTKIYKVGDKVRKNTVDPGNVTQFEDCDASINFLTRVGPDQWSWGYENDTGFCGANSWAAVRGLAYNTYLTVTKVEEPTPVPEDPEPKTVRARVLDEAKRITATDRNSSYGEPEDNFQRIADFWNVFLQDKLKDGVKITPGDTAALVIMVKLAREMNAPKEDNKVDIAGYAACWAEVDD